jgi:hypothetical protein
MNTKIGYQVETITLADGTGTSTQTSANIKFDEGYDNIVGMQVDVISNAQPVTFEVGFNTDKGKNRDLVPSTQYISGTSVAQKDRWIPISIPTNAKMSWLTKLDAALSGNNLSYKITFKLATISQ